MTWVALFVLLASIARAAREVIIAYRYGVGAEVDAYLFIFNLVNWPVAVWAGVLTVVLVPLAARMQRQTAAEIPRFRAELLGLALLLGSGLTVLAAFGLLFLLSSSWTGLSLDSLSYAKSMVVPLSLLTFLGVLIGLLSAWTLAGGRHLNSLLEGVPALVLVVILLAASGGGVKPLVWGTLCGFAVQLAALTIPLARKGAIERPRVGRQSPHWPAFWQGFSIMLAGQTLMGLTTVADQFFAAHLGVGAIATLGYANRILALILGVGALAASRAMLPVFSRAQGAAGHVFDLAAHWTKILFALGIIGLLVAWWLAPWLVELLFRRGAFSSSDAQLVTQVLRYGLAQLPFYFSALVLTSFITSRGLYAWLFWSGAIGLGVKLLGNMLLPPILGIGGIALATGATYAVNLVFLLLVFNRLGRAIGSPRSP
jgi:peptidoglycan biosynthesis protein MviN/MurJ (putative lipid II flippase)